MLELAFGCSSNANAYVVRTIVYKLSWPLVTPFSKQLRALLTTDGDKGTLDSSKEIRIYAVIADDELSYSWRPP